MSSDFYKLMLVTHRQNTPLPKYLEFIKQCASSGITSVQLREKHADWSFKLDFAEQLKIVLEPYKLPLIINDHIDLAKAAEAEGVHLGQSDTSSQKARTQLGSDTFIGLSIESEQQMHESEHYELDYIAASAVFPSQHKNNLQKIWGIDGLSMLCKHSKHAVIGIGGIDQHNLASLIQAGAQGVAVIGALHLAENPAAMTSILRKIIDREIG